MQPDVISQIVGALLPMGLPGVIIIGLTWTVRGLWQTNQEMSKQLLDFAVKSAATMEANTAALNRISDNLVKGDRV